MKKLLLLLILFTSLISAQEFTLTPEGFINNNKNYLVIDLPNQTTSKLKYKNI